MLCERLKIGFSWCRHILREPDRCFRSWDSMFLQEVFGHVFAYSPSRTPGSLSDAPTFFSPFSFGRKAPPFFSPHKASKAVHLQMWLLRLQCHSGDIDFPVLIRASQPGSHLSVQQELLPPPSHFMTLDPPVIHVCAVLSSQGHAGGDPCPPPAPKKVCLDKVPKDSVSQELS